MRRLRWRRRRRLDWQAADARPSPPRCCLYCTHLPTDNNPSPPPCTDPCCPHAAPEVGVDDGLVVETKEEVFEMNNGCICCTGGFGGVERHVKGRIMWCAHPGSAAFGA